MKKMLIAIDDSPNATKAVEYVAQQFAGAADLEVGLVHVLPNLPAIFWDEGHILSEERRRTGKRSWTSGSPTGRPKWRRRSRRPSIH